MGASLSTQAGRKKVSLAKRILSFVINAGKIVGGAILSGVGFIGFGVTLIVSGVLGVVGTIVDTVLSRGEETEAHDRQQDVRRVAASQERETANADTLAETRRQLAESVARERQSNLEKTTLRARLDDIEASVARLNEEVGIQEPAAQEQPRPPQPSGAARARVPDPLNDDDDLFAGAERKPPQPSPSAPPQPSGNVRAGLFGNVEKRHAELREEKEKKEVKAERKASK